MSESVHVAVAVILNDSGQVCISLRDKSSHQGGLWEFPGGKIEQGETAEQALKREIKEELDLDISSSRPLITINHNYPDEKVCLHVRKVESFHGKAIGIEGQLVNWVAVSALSEYDFPAANIPIISAIQLPEKYMITGKFIDTVDFVSKLQKAINNNISLVQLRLKSESLPDKSLVQTLVEQASTICKQGNAKLMLNLSEDLIESVDLSQITYSGIHADSKTLKHLSEDTASFVKKSVLFSASCHNTEELRLAMQLKADFVVLSPVQKTASHPDMKPIGWSQFSEMIRDIPIPVYALGGVSEKDMEASWSNGAQGISAISAFWK